MKARVTKIKAEASVPPGQYGPFNIHCILNVNSDGSVDIEMDERIPGMLVLKIEPHKDYGGKPGLVLNYVEKHNGQMAN